jgi:hypothetical protein
MVLQFIKKKYFFIFIVFLNRGKRSDYDNRDNEIFIRVMKIFCLRHEFVFVETLIGDIKIFH